MSTLYKLNSSFALTYAAFSDDEQSLAVNLDKHAVTGDTGCKLDAQISDKRSDEGCCAVVRPCDRHFVFLSYLEHFGIKLVTSCDDEKRYLRCKQSVDTLIPCCFVERCEVSELHISAYLDTLCVEILVKAHKLESGSVAVVLGNGYLVDAIG